MDKMDEVLELLAANGDSYTLDEISKSVGIHYDLCERVVQFLSKYGFVCLNGLKVKIDPNIKNFIIETSARTVLQLAPRATAHV